MSDTTPGRQTHFEGLIVPFELTELTGERVLVLAPHADDETFGCGGSIYKHRERAESVKLVILTDGAAAKPGYDGTPDPDYVEGRRKEAREACVHLDVQDIEFWDLPDRGVKPDGPARQRLVELIRTWRPALIYATSLHEFHPDHRACAHLAWAAIAEAKHPCRLVLYEVNRPFKVDTLVDISDVIEIKRKAAAEYRSQLDIIKYDDFVIGLNRARALTVADRATYCEGFQVVEYDQISRSTIDVWLLDQFFSERRITRSETAPLVSIVIRTRNRPGLLREALFSACQQDYGNVELVVVNDGGVPIDDVIAEFEGRLPIRFIEHEQSKGRSAAANVGMQNASGKYINFLDDDDLLYPDHLEKLVSFLENTREKVAFSECDMGKYIWADGTYRRMGEKELYPSKDFSREELIRDNFIPIMTVVFARDCLKDVEGFDENLDHFEDWDFWIRLSKAYQFHKLPGASAEYRLLDQKLDAQRQKNTIRWRAALYAKYPEYWTPERIVEYGWSRIHGLQEDLAELQRLYRKLLRKRERTEFEKEFGRWQDWSRQKMNVVISAIRRSGGQQ